MTPARAAKIWENPNSQEWNLKELEKISNLIDIPTHVSEWENNHLQEKEALRK